MLSNICLQDKWYQHLSWLFIALLAVSVPSSRALMSIAEIALIALWLWNGKWRQKWQAFVSNRLALVLVALFVWHVVGVLYSQDMTYAMKDLRTKLPMLILPLVFTALPRFSKKQFLGVLVLFIGSVLFVSTYVSIEHAFSGRPINTILADYFVSHVRFGLNMNLAFFYLLFIWWIHKPKQWWWMVVYVLGAVSLLFGMLYLEAFTTVAIFAILLVILLFVFLLSKQSKRMRGLVLLVLGLSIGGSIWYLYDFVETNTQVQSIHLSDLDTHTAYGEPYVHRIDAQIENGHQVFIYLAEKEMQVAWNQRSAYAYMGKDKSNQELRFTLIRYLTSKGLRKDRDGVMQLSETDIQNIEKGIANVHYAEGFGVKARLYKILFEYHNYVQTGNPSGFSVMQRIEFWKAAVHIIKQHPWFGVGTGDVNIAFAQAYEQTNSQLRPEFRYRSHNQYLSIMVALGGIGFLIMLFSFVYPWIDSNNRHFFYMVFFIILLLSMLTEDTLESQAGLTFYAFFNSFLLLLAPLGIGKGSVNH